MNSNSNIISMNINQATMSDNETQYYLNRENKLLFKRSGLDTRGRPVYQDNGKPSKGFGNLIKDGKITPPADFKYIYNTKTKRFVDKKTIYDQRKKTPTLKKKF